MYILSQGVHVVLGSRVSLERVFDRTPEPSERSSELVSMEDRYVCHGWKYISPIHVIDLLAEYMIK
jgi:hypothetical protein